MNVFTAVIRLGTDAEQKYTAGGDSIVTFNGAVDSGYGDKKVTTWIRYTIWGKRGESVLPYLTKGSQVAVSGELANRPWKDKEGQDKYSLEVRVNELTLIGGKQNSANVPAQKESNSSNRHENKAQDGDFEDSIPF